MGFRLGLIKGSNYDKQTKAPKNKYDYYSTKYFGYVDEGIAVKSESYTYLKSINKLPEIDSDDFHFWMVAQTTPVKLTHDEFVNFIGCYSRDYLKFDHLGQLNDYDLMQDAKIKQLIDSNESVYVDWG